jgi:hypothetical protein
MYVFKTFLMTLALSTAIVDFHKEIYIVQEKEKYKYLQEKE